MTKRATSKNDGNGSGGTRTEVAVEFLEQLRPGGPWVLTAIDPNTEAIGTITARTSDEVDTFVRKHGGKRNLYYSVNPTRTAMSKKAAKTDIGVIEYALADLDPNANETSDAAKARYLKQLNNGFEPKPTAAIDSGNGIQALWKLQDQIVLGMPVDGKFAAEDQAKIDPVEARIEAVMLRLGSKAGTQNIDRILRLPGTTNLPNKKKKREGRVACQTKLLWFNGASYPLEAFPAAKETKPAPFDTFEDIAPNDPRLSKLHKKWITLGFAGEGIDEDYAGDRSRAVLAFACECVRAKIADKVIASCLMQWEIGQHVREQGNAKRALQRTITRAHEFVANSALFKMNEQHAVLPIGGKTRVATWGEDADFPGYRSITRFSSFEDFRALQDKHRYSYRSKDKKGNVETITIGRGTWWIGHPQRRQYDDGMRFMPGHDEDVVGDTLNLWQGFAINARKPEGKSGAAGCKLFLDHGRKIICSGDAEHFDYLMKREAFIAQMRTRSEIAVGLHTEEEGTGKGFWCRTLNRLYGVHAMQVQKPDHVIGKHNKHLEILLRLTADEALFVGDHRHRNALYGLVTEPTVDIEPKFIDVYTARNYVNIDVLSNAKHFIAVSGTARRFFVPTVSADRASDHAYFKEILEQLNDGGYEALLYHLLHEIDIRDFNVRDVPKTAALAEQVSYSRTGIELLVEKACNEGRVPFPHYNYAELSVCIGHNSIGDDDPRLGFDWFVEHHADRDLSRMGSLMVKRRLTKEWGCITGKATRKMEKGSRVSGVIWPPLPELRERFEKRFGPQEWLRPRIAEWQNSETENKEEQAAPLGGDKPPPRNKR